MRLNPVIAFLVVFAGTAFGCGPEASEVHLDEDGQMGSHSPAPDFTLTTLEGADFQLTDHEGKVIILNFWATWCPPCRAEVPEFVELQEEYGSDRVLFVGISLDREGPDIVRDFAEEFDMNYPVMIDDGTVAGKYGDVHSLPTTYIIDKQGLIRNRVRGLLSEKVLRPVIDRLLAEEQEMTASASAG